MKIQALTLQGILPISGKKPITIANHRWLEKDPSHCAQPENLTIGLFQGKPVKMTTVLHTPRTRSMPIRGLGCLDRDTKINHVTTTITLSSVTQPGSSLGMIVILRFLMMIVLRYQCLLLSILGFRRKSVHYIFIP